MNLAEGCIMRKLIYLSVLLILISGCAITNTGRSQVKTSQERENPWHNVCPNSTCAIYCEKVGKDAYNAYSEPKNVKLGKIEGVAWRPKGSIISVPGGTCRTSPRNAYYYIIDDGWGTPFLRQCREIRAK